MTRGLIIIVLFGILGLLILLVVLYASSKCERIIESAFYERVHRKH